MKTLRIGEHTVTAWAERLDDRWHGLASIAPKIPNTWSGGPNGDSLICDGSHQSEQVAEASALDEAVKALAQHLDGVRYQNG